MDDNATSSHSTRVQTPLLNNFVDGAFDYRGRPVLRSKSSLWRSAYFIVVPLTRSITKKPSGITMFQRIGIGILITIALMVVSPLVETKRLKIAREYGSLDDPESVIPMKIWWLLPQYLFAGASNGG
ncbi:hypothetical protein L1887_20261 [Cichorium endivia]|nr:hypothetical protein L1887_20261 [Cichorium endivia]